MKLDVDIAQIQRELTDSVVAVRPQSADGLGAVDDLGEAGQPLLGGRAEVGVGRSIGRRVPAAKLAHGRHADAVTESRREPGKQSRDEAPMKPRRTFTSFSQYGIADDPPGQTLVLGPGPVQVHDESVSLERVDRDVEAGVPQDLRGPAAGRHRHLIPGAHRDLAAVGRHARDAVAVQPQSGDLKQRNQVIAEKVA